MSSSSVAVLGLDAADHALLNRWDCQNLLLNNDRQIETKAYTLEHPSTFEIWPSIATGVTPHEHGVWLEANDREVGGGIYQTLASLNSYLPDPLKERIVDLKRGAVGNELPTTTHDHIFRNGAVYNWPGVSPSRDFSQQTSQFGEVVEGTESVADFRRDQVVYTGRSLGWLMGHTEARTSIAGIHVHILDYFGHLYGEQPDALREVYEQVDRMVGRVREQFDELVIVSDHGMETKLLSEKKGPGEHSFRATFSTTADGELPESVFDIRSWLDERISTDTKEIEGEAHVDAPKEHLEDLGYM